EHVNIQSRRERHHRRSRPADRRAHLRAHRDQRRRGGIRCRGIHPDPALRQRHRPQGLPLPGLGHARPRRDGPCHPAAARRDRRAGGGGGRRPEHCHRLGNRREARRLRPAPLLPDRAPGLAHCGRGAVLRCRVVPRCPALVPQPDHRHRPGARPAVRLRRAARCLPARGLPRRVRCVQWI
ncbi:MAG: hypothetical protein AVDCRST_MAG83-1657, partial [uncultured Arthrobacter sp.]